MFRRKKYFLNEALDDSALEIFEDKNIQGISYRIREEKMSNLVLNKIRARMHKIPKFGPNTSLSKTKSDSHLNEFEPEKKLNHNLSLTISVDNDLDKRTSPKNNRREKNEKPSLKEPTTPKPGSSDESKKRKSPSPHRGPKYHDIFPRWRADTKCQFCAKTVGLNNHVTSAPDDVCRRCTLVGSMTSLMDNCYNAMLDMDEKMKQNMTLINLLAMNALQLSIPACDGVLKKRRNDFIQLAGHPGGFAPAGPNTIWKRRMQNNFNEKQVYEELVTDDCYDVVPGYFREVEHNGEYFIEMEDLLYHFNNPNIMDIKMGTRTFLESEVQNPIKREDLYYKMVKLDEHEPSEQEHRDRAITKLRYMQFRERESSTSNLGFRIEAVKLAGMDVKKDFKRVKMANQVEKVLLGFTQENIDICRKLTARLKYIREKFQASIVFKHREIIGASLLLLYDSDGEAGAWIIDFVKTLYVEETLDHRAEWRLGNHEDGFLTGMDNLIQIFESCCDR